MLTKRASLICLGSMGLLIGMARGDYGSHCECLVRHAGDLRQHARELGTEFRHAYRSTSQYGALQAHVRQITTEAGHLQAHARGHADIHALRCDANSLSQSYRLLVQTVRAADASCGAGYPGPAWRYGNNPIRNDDVRNLLACMDNLLREIHAEIARFPPSHHGYGGTGDHSHGSRFEGPSGFTFNTPANQSRKGISLSNGRFTIQLGR